MGRETNEARALWQCVRDAAPRMRVPFDESWVRQLLVGDVEPSMPEPDVPIVAWTGVRRRIS